MITKVKVLIVEDEVLVAKDIKMQLEDLDYEVCQIATRADEALRATEIHNPDLILMDINIDGPFDGIETAEKIGLTSNSPIIFLTDLRDDETFNRALEIGPATFLNKPVHEFQLSRQISVAIHNAAKSIKPDQFENELLLMNDAFFIKTGESTHSKLTHQDIQWIKANGSYCEIVTDSGKHTLSKNMREVVDFINSPLLTKIHKSYTVNLKRVSKIKGAELVIGNEVIPIGKTYLQSVKEKLRLI